MRAKGRGEGEGRGWGGVGVEWGWSGTGWSGTGWSGMGLECLEPHHLLLSRRAVAQPDEHLLVPAADLGVAIDEGAADGGAGDEMVEGREERGEDDGVGQDREHMLWVWRETSGARRDADTPWIVREVPRRHTLPGPRTQAWGLAATKAKYVFVCELVHFFFSTRVVDLLHSACSMQHAAALD